MYKLFIDELKLSHRNINSFMPDKYRISFIFLYFGTIIQSQYSIMLFCTSVFIVLNIYSSEKNNHVTEIRKK